MAQRLHKVALVYSKRRSAHLSGAGQPAVQLNNSADLENSNVVSGKAANELGLVGTDSSTYTVIGYVESAEEEVTCS